MSTIKRSKTDAFSVKESVNIVKLAEAAFEQISLDQLTDVVVETPTDGDILVYSSDLMAWENVPQGDLNYNLEGLDNITITSVSNGQVLTWDSGTSKWVNETPTTGATTLDGLTDVNTLGVAGGMVLMYNSDTSEWNAESLGYPNSLDDLTDVTITTPSNGQVLKYNGSAWVNGADSGATPGGSDTYVQYNDGGVLGGESTFTYNKTNNELTVSKVKTNNISGIVATDQMTIVTGENSTTAGIGLSPSALAPTFVTEMSVYDIYHEGNLTAAATSYDNSTSGLTSTDVQGAIDEIAASSGGSAYTDYVQPFLRRAGYRFFPGKPSDTAVSSRSMSGNWLYLIPFVAPRDMSIVDAAVYFTSADGIDFQVGIYENQFSSGQDSPGTRIAHASATSIVGSNVVAMSASLTAGNVYWLAFAMASNTYLYSLADGDSYSVFGTNATSAWAAVHTYAYVPLTSTVPSTVSSVSMVITGGSRPAILLGE